MVVYTFNYDVNTVFCLELFISRPLWLPSLSDFMTKTHGAGLRDQQSREDAPGFKCERSGQQPARPGKGTPRARAAAGPDREITGTETPVLLPWGPGPCHLTLRAHTHLPRCPPTCSSCPVPPTLPPSHGNDHVTRSAQLLLCRGTCRPALTGWVALPVASGPLPGSQDQPVPTEGHKPHSEVRNLAGSRAESQG